jgi:hypothetical protein
MADVCCDDGSAAKGGAAIFAGGVGVLGVLGEMGFEVSLLPLTARLDVSRLVRRPRPSPSREDPADAMSILCMLLRLSVAEPSLLGRLD